MARVAIYLRVSTDQQTTENQRLELTAWADRCGHTVVKVFEDRAISGAKSSAERPGLRALLKDAVLRRFDLVAVWSVDRLGRSLQDLTATLAALESSKVDFFSHQQAIDTTTSTGKAMFGMVGVFAEFERSIIVERVRAGIARVRATGKTKSGKAIGRPRVSQKALDAARTALAAPGASIRTVAAATGLSAGKVSQIRKDGMNDDPNPPAST